MTLPFVESSSWPRRTFHRKHVGFANPRSLTNGLVNKKTVNDNIARDTDFVAYEVVSPRLPKSQQWKVLATLGLKVANHKVVHAISEDDLAYLYIERRGALHTTSTASSLKTKAPTGWPRRETLSMLLPSRWTLMKRGFKQLFVDVEWEASKDSKLIPRVRYDPVTIDGTVLRWGYWFQRSLHQ